MDLFIPFISTSIATRARSHMFLQRAPSCLCKCPQQQPSLSSWRYFPTLPRNPPSRSLRFSSTSSSKKGTARLIVKERAVTHSPQGIYNYYTADGRYDWVAKGPSKSSRDEAMKYVRVNLPTLYHYALSLGMDRSTSMDGFLLMIDSMMRNTFTSRPSMKVVDKFPGQGNVKDPYYVLLLSLSLFLLLCGIATLTLR